MTQLRYNVKHSGDMLKNLTKGRKIYLLLGAGYNHVHACSPSYTDDEE